MHHISVYTLLTNILFIVLFNWINLPNAQDFAFVLQNDLVHGQVVGVEKFINGESLSLQLQVSLFNNSLKMY